ncbi:MAG: hypothetical protein EA350_13815 [Gemmatimonadales bacterium]|nr:MAG: hypothetical protein EA350_13815 [Gemmatimonadales bacterium]
MPGPFSWDDLNTQRGGGGRGLRSAWRPGPGPARHTADKRIFPAIDVNRSGTRREELLFSGAELNRGLPASELPRRHASLRGHRVLHGPPQADEANNEFLESMQSGDGDPIRRRHPGRRRLPPIPLWPLRLGTTARLGPKLPLDNWGRGGG